MSRLFVLVGEGIECEKESARFFANPAFGFESVEWMRIQDLLARSKVFDLQSQDWVFLPGGFSYADHFGSGRLLAYELERVGFFADCFKRGVHLMGVCNGFQILTEAGLFGKDVRLVANRGMGFTNRWIRLKGSGVAEGGEFFLPVRHGEGQLVRKASAWEPGVEPFLIYHDEHFDNGSVDRVAGLLARKSLSRVVGLMPHPEIAARPVDRPDSLGTEWPPDTRSQIMDTNADGTRLMKTLIQTSMGLLEKER